MSEQSFHNVDVVITTPTPAGQVHPDVAVVPADAPHTTPLPAGELAPDVPVVSPPQARPRRLSAPPDFDVGQVVTYTYGESGTGREQTQTGVVVAIVPVENEEGGATPHYVVGWFPSVSDPLPADALAEVT